MADRVIVEILVAAPIETVWKAVKDPAEARRWFGWDYPNLADDLVGMWSGNRADDENHELHADPMPDRFKLEALGAHTIVRIIRSAPAEDPSWHGIYDDLAEGWLTFMQQLKFALERHPGEERRTIFLNGRAKQAGDPDPITALGLAKLWVTPVGEAYDAKMSTGEHANGIVWYRSGNQLGLTVKGFGDGLLIFNVRPKTEKSLHGGGTITLTTYGVDDATFQQMRQRWSEWWSRTYEVIEIQP